MPIVFRWALRPKCPVRRRKIVVCWVLSSLQTGSRCAWYPHSAGIKSRVSTQLESKAGYPLSWNQKQGIHSAGIKSRVSTQLESKAGYSLSWNQKQGIHSAGIKSRVFTHFLLLMTASLAQWSRRPPRERQTWVRFPLLLRIFCQVGSYLLSFFCLPLIPLGASREERDVCLLPRRNAWAGGMLYKDGVSLTALIQVFRGRPLALRPLDTLCDFKIGAPVATQPGAGSYRVRAGTGWPGVRILWLSEREKVWSANSISVGQHVHSSEEILPWDTPACYWDVNQKKKKKKASNQQTILLTPACCRRWTSRRAWVADRGEGEGGGVGRARGSNVTALHLPDTCLWWGTPPPLGDR